jgi:hypothetical protein
VPGALLACDTKPDDAAVAVEVTQRTTHRQRRDTEGLCDAVPPVGEIARHPIRVLLATPAFGLEAPRRALIVQHCDAFEEPALDSFDPSKWMARSLADQIVALLQALDLYRHVVPCTAAEDF